MKRNTRIGMLLVLLVIIAAFWVMLSVTQAQEGIPYLPLPTISRVAVQCDYDPLPGKDMVVKFTTDVKAYYRVNGTGPQLPAEVHGLYAAQNGFGWIGDLQVIVKNDGQAQPSTWDALRIEMRQSYQQPDGSYIQVWIPLVELAPLDCSTIPVNPTPRSDGVASELPWQDGGLHLGRKLNTDTTYAVFAGNFGIRVYGLNGQRLGQLITALTPDTIQQIALNPQSAVVLTVSADQRVLIYRESNGRFGIRLKLDGGNQVVALDRLP